MQFTGRENDDTGLYYYRARYYHPVLARFIGEDPIGMLGGDVNIHAYAANNLYAYVGNAPLDFIDPFGLDRQNPSGDLLDPHTGEPTELSESGAGGLAKIAARLAARYLNRLPKKGGGGGKPQNYDPHTGKYAKQNPFADSPAWQFGQGFGEGLGVSLYGGELPPAVGARRTVSAKMTAPLVETDQDRIRELLGALKDKTTWR